MRTITRSGAVALSAVTTAAVVAPAFASNPTPTSLNLRAGKSVVKAHHQDTFTATLSSKGKPLAAQSVNLQERTVSPTGHKSAWTTPTAACTTDVNGRCQFTVTPTIAPGHHTQKDQFRATYAGGSVATTTYGSSHSQIITVTVKRS